MGQAIGFYGDVSDGETFFAYTDFLTPASISRLDVASGAISSFRAPKFAADLSGYVTEQVFYPSKDGTRVPMFITRKRDFVKDGQAPLMLYGYGGFNIAQQPAFSVPVLVWLEMGGVYAVANLRGGSEYGEAWHSAGTKLQKQNVFDDFIAAAEWLIAEKYTSTPKLAIRGRSNGGLLVGAVADAASGSVRRHAARRRRARHAALSHAERERAPVVERLWAQRERSGVQGAVRLLTACTTSKPGTCYPPTLVTTADRDDRVVPWHSYKFAAELQRAQGCAQSGPAASGNARGTWRRQAGVDADRGLRRSVGVPGEVAAHGAADRMRPAENASGGWRIVSAVRLSARRIRLVAIELQSPGNRSAIPSLSRRLRLG